MIYNQFGRGKRYGTEQALTVKCKQVMSVFDMNTQACAYGYIS